MRVQLSWQSTCLPSKMSTVRTRSPAPIIFTFSVDTYPKDAIVKMQAVGSSWMFVFAVIAFAFVMFTVVREDMKVGYTLVPSEMM